MIALKLYVLDLLAHTVIEKSCKLQSAVFVVNKLYVR